jgi:predicted N-acetyltransferase YhbS
MKLQEPIPINKKVLTEGFFSQETQLDEWLKKRALKNEQLMASRTFVVCGEDNKVVGYYSLAVGSVLHAEVAGKIKRNMPDPVPVMILGRLAVDKKVQGKGLGSALIKDAVLRTLQASKIAGIKAILVHALDEKAAIFYENRGFKRSPMSPLILLITLDEALHTMDGK